MHRSIPAHRPVRLLCVAIVLALLATACGNGDADDAARVVTDDGHPESRSGEGFDLAAAASFRVADTTTDRVTPDGVTLGVDAEYFEPLSVQGWTAPDECAFNTLVDVTVDASPWASPPFDGPSAATEDDQVGFLGAVLPMTAPNTGEPARLVLVVAFAHRTVVTVELTDPVQSDYAALDTQPADGWTSLGLLVPADDESADQPVDVTVTSQDAEGEIASTSLSVPPATDRSLAVLTPEWVFDEAAVGDQCEPPANGTDPLNLPDPGDTDLLGGAIGDKPAAPPPGEQPPDPAGATAAALDAIRIVYDIGDIYDEDKIAHLERPTDGARIMREIREQQVVEPYLANLDPLFDSVVFTSPTEASVLYRVGPSYHWEIGRVLLIDGTWQVALGTLCRDLSDAFYTCPNVVQDPRPGPLG